MSNRLLKLREAREELKAVEHNLRVTIPFSPSLNLPAPSHSPTANLCATPEDSNFKCTLTVPLSISTDKPYSLISSLMSVDVSFQFIGN